jgi:hypothetical protein
MKFDLFGAKVIFVFLIVFSSLGAGLENAKILLSSSTGKSIVISRGRLQGLSDGQVATFFMNLGSLDFPKLEKVAEGELIRSLDNKSYWYLHTIFNPAKVKKSSLLVMDVKSKHMRGNRDFSVVNRKRIYTDETTTKDVTYENENGVPKNLVHDEESYIASKKLYETKKTKEHDIEIHQFDTWSKRNGLTTVDDFMREFERKYVNENFKDADISKAETEKIKNTIYRAQIDGFLSKINSQKYGLDGLYHDQKRDRNMVLLKENLDVQNVYETARQERKRKRILGTNKSKKIDRDGKLWSADFTDESLRRYMVQSGIEEEERRQYESLTQKSGNELSFRISNGLASHATDEDANHQNKGYALSLGYEYHLMRTSPSLLKFSLEVFAQRSVENVDLGGINGRFSSGSFGGQVLYYFYNNPASLKMWSWYGGLGIRRGNADVTSVELSSDYEFQVMGLPIWSVGTKYRFKTGDSYDDDLPIGAGINIRLSGERMELSSISSVVDDINSNIVINDIKLTVGLSVFF